MAEMDDYWKLLNEGNTCQVCGQYLYDKEAAKLRIENKRLRVIESRAKLVIKEWERYGHGVAPPLVEQLAELRDDLAGAQEQGTS